MSSKVAVSDKKASRPTQAENQKALKSRAFPTVDSLILVSVSIKAISPLVKSLGYTILSRRRIRLIYAESGGAPLVGGARLLRKGNLKWRPGFDGACLVLHRREEYRRFIGRETMQPLALAQLNDVRRQ